MQSPPILILAMCLLAISSVSAMPQRRVKSQRQVEYSSTPYPAAGFRPRIPFNLPGEPEQQPKLETEPLTTTTSTATPTEVETLENTEPLSTTEQQQPQEETETEADLEVSVRIPANTYGVPAEQEPQDAQDTVEVVAQEPARDFQPPSLDAVEDFAADSALAAGGEQPVADVPALGQAEPEDSEPEVIPEAKAVAPAETYGPPATTYGVPELGEPQNELDAEESQVELVEEEEALANELASGRLILLPLGARGAQFGRLVLAVEQPRQRLRSERLRRI
ncbi:LOW QUALITY PROTEIN: fibrous sheath CABYR-binding protein [Drosophila ficusphila]|uniref:LOW QUALITY PROTEIN: fibrous sheath CABYR-binding protein n=1 Tax=Drosophila ficusphila TaxID=30025 RepID=UPI0007E88DAE|nr:LOW QUALITY PROTEIN: fibrous sheath CABYR-binding protein [Drosophila ficusphila]